MFGISTEEASEILREVVKRPHIYLFYFETKGDLRRNWLGRWPKKAIQNVREDLPGMIARGELNRL